MLQIDREGLELYQPVESGLNSIRAHRPPRFMGALGPSIWSSARVSSERTASARVDVPIEPGDQAIGVGSQLLWTLPSQKLSPPSSCCRMT